MRENTWNLLFVLANKTKLWKEWKMEFTKRGPMSDARIWSLMKLKGLLMRVDYYFLFNSVHLWTVPLSFTLFMVTTSTKRQDLLDHFKLIMRLKILPHQRLSLQEPRKSITYSLINSVLWLKTPGGSSSIWLLPNSLGKDIPWFQLKVLLFRNCCYRRFFYFILSVGLTVYLCRARIKHTLMLIRRF